MLTDTDARLMVLTQQVALARRKLEGAIAPIEDAMRQCETEQRDQLRDVVLTLKHLIDFDLVRSP